MPSDTVVAQPAADGAMPVQAAGAGPQLAKAPPRPDATTAPAGLPSDVGAMFPPGSADAVARLAATPPAPTRTLARIPTRFATPDKAVSAGDPTVIQAAGVPAGSPVASTVPPVMPAGVVATQAPIATSQLSATASSEAPATNGVGSAKVASTTANGPSLGETSTPPATAAADASATPGPVLPAPLPDETRHAVETPLPNAALPPAPLLSQQPATAVRAVPAGHRAIDAGSARAAMIGRDVGLAIARHVDRGGASTVTIRLDPVELGRVEVRLQIDPAGKLLAAIAADQPAALDLLRRDSAMLAQTLSQAGVQADVGSFSFDTRSGGGGRGGAFPAPARSPVDTADDPPSGPQTAKPGTLHASGRINLVA
ncbi:flagellar hook-length control protein FliK [Sphingomonas sp. PAMC 26617]|uniref:flagellar hook-length control protein FliK n=1 Tax=Sphingomonas sp. PAMC 26617 TaxID=1112216 RepID=UPI0002885B06|nr:flagellar hook-length control protein FliK [Sphingomonas sp. PAMC 26617]